MPVHKHLSNSILRVYTREERQVKISLEQGDKIMPTYHCTVPEGLLDARRIVTKGERIAAGKEGRRDDVIE
jgi:hypothetical protein